MSNEKVVAVYDSEGSANAAVRALKAAGYSANNISVIRNEGEAEAAGLHEPGVWRHLFGSDLEHHEAAVFGKSLKEGSAIVAVRVMESEAPKVISILDSHKPVDVRDRAEAYGFVGAPAAATTPKVPTARLTDEETMQLAEERLNVGKRTVESGMTRVRRYVIENPVETNVTLHEEHAEIFRRAISDPTFVKEVDWSNKTFEVTETAEEAVVDKTARIAEEVVIRRTGSDRMQTVRDTVRRQQLDVERVPVGAGGKKGA
jgi:uncharacterized protein (TIGR02271 family)